MSVNSSSAVASSTWRTSSSMPIWASFMSITIHSMIDPSPSWLRLQSHSRLTPRWTRLRLAYASHLHYIVGMKTSTLPAVRVEPALRSDAEAVLDEGESLSDFVASCVRDGVAWRRTQDAFLARARDAVERSEREDSGISPQEVLRQMDVRLEAARQRLAAGKPSAGQ
jgi:hypothetical protein